MTVKNTDINILKSTIDNLIQENKQLLESNKQLKMEERKLRDLISVYASSLENQITLILGSSKLLPEYYKSSQQPSREQMETISLFIYRIAKKLQLLTEHMKRDASGMESKNPVGKSIVLSPRSNYKRHSDSKLFRHYN